MNGKVPRPIRRSWTGWRKITPEEICDQTMDNGETENPEALAWTRMKGVEKSSHPTFVHCSIGTKVLK